MENNTNNASRGEIVIYQTADGTTAVDVRLENDTVWLSQEMMSRLFKKDRTVIGRHIRNIYSDGELREDSTCAKFAHMGSRGVQPYVRTLYNLDVIISVGYRVHSQEQLSERCRLMGKVLQVCIILPTCSRRTHQWPISAPGRPFFADLLRFGQLPATVDRL